MHILSSVRKEYFFLCYPPYLQLNHPEPHSLSEPNRYRAGVFSPTQGFMTAQSLIRCLQLSKWQSLHITGHNQNKYLTTRANKPFQTVCFLWGSSWSAHGSDFLFKSEQMDKDSRNGLLWPLKHSNFSFTFRDFPQVLPSCSNKSSWGGKVNTWEALKHNITQCLGPSRLLTYYRAWGHLLLCPPMCPWDVHCRAFPCLCRPGTGFFAPLCTDGSVDA